MGERIGPARIDRIHDGGLRGNGMKVLSDGNGSREVSFLGRKREVDVSGKNGEAVGIVKEFLQEEFGINEEMAEVFAQEIYEMKEE